MSHYDEGDVALGRNKAASIFCDIYNDEQCESRAIATKAELFTKVECFSAVLSILMTCLVSLRIITTCACNSNRLKQFFSCLSFQIM